MSDAKKDLLNLKPSSRARWRAWLRGHHASSPGVWLAVAKKGGSAPGVSYEEAVEEALCFGWIDGQSMVLDRDFFRIRMTPRRPGSTWARSNKQRIRRLTAEGRMAAAGLARVEAARRDGSWMKLEEAERLSMPAGLRTALRANPAARQNFDRFSESVKRRIYAWIRMARRDATRARRVAEAVRLAAENLPPGGRTPSDR